VIVEGIVVAEPDARDAGINLRVEAGLIFSQIVHFCRSQPSKRCINLVSTPLYFLL
jgi:hypothetical protein